ncbi:hypothetical protein WG922_13795 [Ramlibacter sp. AN1015]|uniref:hypothetical protein n=1 Tax=Ramlibacter sp. AN1015 TaxID=3133428 RepID=UPI0030C44111
MRLSQPRRPAGGGGHCVQPAAGLVQTDAQGQVWLCEAVIRNGEIADWYLVRLSRLEGSQPVGEPVVLSRTEYERFSTSRGLQAVLL